MEEAGIKTTNSSQICCRITLQKLSVQLYSPVISVQRDAKTFNDNKHSWKMLFICLSAQINWQHVFKMSACGTYAYFE